MSHAQLTTTFPDFKASILEILQDGNKVIVCTWHTEDWLTGLSQLGFFEE